MQQNELIENIQSVHTTPMGVERIKRNLSLSFRSSSEIVEFCKNLICDKSATIERSGKNWYVKTFDNVITVNAFSFTIITAHKIKIQIQSVK